MWDGLLVLVLLCTVMASASFLVGSLPLSLSLSAKHLRIITALGTGVLVGTALIVIIPEGVETLYSAEGSSHNHERRAWFPLRSRAKTPPPPENHDPHAYVGISIILGFILMYLIDNLPRHISKSSQPRRFQINLTSLSFNRDQSASNENAETNNNSDHDSADPRASSTTVGLVIHAAADGIALGASSTTKGNLGFIVFVALMVHKAPAAFGLTSVLLKQGLGKRAARAHLIVFSLAAPVGALLTWAAANLLGYNSLGGSASTEFVTGILLLFSGGTFLYVAMHTMQDAPHDRDESNQNGYTDTQMGMYESQQNKSGGGDGLTDVIVTVVGMLLPLLTQWGHAH